MRNRALGRVLVVAVAGLVGAACGPTWQVVKQASPNPLVGKTSFALEALSFDGYKVGGKQLTEEEWVATKKPEKQEEFRQSLGKDKEGAAEKFAARLTDKLGGSGITLADGGEFIIKARVVVYEPGFWSPAGWGTINTFLSVNVKITESSGNELDEVVFNATIPPGVFNPASGQRIRQAAEQLADQIDAYMKGRTAAAK